MSHRFTDFLVFEVNQDHQVIHLKSLGMPESSSKKGKVSDINEDSSSTTVAEGSLTQLQKPIASVESNTAEKELSAGTEAKGKDDAFEDTSWNAQFSETLAPYLSETSIEQLKKMFIEGREPPRVSDSGWGGRSAKTSGDAAETSDAPKQFEEVTQNEETGKQGRSRGGRGGRGGRGRGRGGRQGGEREDHRKVLSEVRCLVLSHYATLFLGSRFSLKLTGQPCIKLFESYLVGSLIARLIR